MLADGRNSHTKQLSHSFLCGLNGFVLRRSSCAPVDAQAAKPEFFRSEILKLIWCFARLFVTLSHNYRRKYMSGMKIYIGEFDKQLELLLALQIKAGFPSPAQDYMRERALLA